MNFDGQIVPMNVAWRNNVRRYYRHVRRTYGPMGARKFTERYVADICEAEAERAEAEAQYRHDRWADETYG